MKVSSLLAALLCAIPLPAQHSYPLKLQVMSFETVQNGYQVSGETTTDLGGVHLSSGRTVVSGHTTVNTATLLTDQGTIKCVIWNKKRYLEIGTYETRQLSGSELEVRTVTRKGKSELLRFKVLSAARTD